VKFRSEQAFLNAVVDLARMSGWLVHHDREKQNVQGHAGFPDLVLVGKGRVLFRELKMSDKVRVQGAQSAWAGALINNHGDWETWRPGDWNDIVEILTGRRPVAEVVARDGVSEYVR